MDSLNRNKMKDLKLTSLYVSEQRGLTKEYNKLNRIHQISL